MTVLSDKKANGKERPWRDKKLANLDYYELLKILEFKKAARVSSCAEVLEFDVNDSGRFKLAKAWFCKSALCPICNWRRSMTRSVQTTKIVEAVIQKKPKARWLFLTLTVKNVFDGVELDKSLRALTKGFNSLVKYKKVAKNLIGYMRSTEVTVNKKDGSYNQHLHVLLCVKSTYFRDEENYLTQSEWTSLWKRAMKLSYIPVVHIEVVKERKLNKVQETNAINSAIRETAKYSVKDSDYSTGDLEHDLQVVGDLEEGLSHKRLISYGGLLKEVHKLLHLKDVDDSLINTSKDLNCEERAYSIIACWNWTLKNYYIV